jgi:hypothetical protein
MVGNSFRKEKSGVLGCDWTVLVGRLGENAFFVLFFFFWVCFGGKFHGDDGDDACSSPRMGLVQPEGRTARNDQHVVLQQQMKISSCTATT